MKKTLYLLFLATTAIFICITDWIPSLNFERIRWLVLLIILFSMGYLIYKITIEIHQKLSKKNSKTKRKILTTLFSLLLTGMVLFLVFINTIFFLFANTFLKKYTFEDKTFYVYEIQDFIYLHQEVSMKIDGLPIRKVLFSTSNFYEEDKALLVHEGNSVYYFGGDEKVEVYGFGDI